ncbi:hypothetical protein L2Y90_21255 [Burkholderia pyrrocinia]|uniref:hypothetical protein n=1 Tax=Burkholderia pyrrocinia TaxID=60550 RepID=UPI00215AE6A2|nr:hypothetical protein [Burkholderia pyrrocinia]UVE69270.1 hypothetical protein L2Y90_21255 [Burkholderia pyrrocinia]
METSEIGKMIGNTAFFIKRLYITYRWSTTLSRERLSRATTGNHLTWWTYTLVTSILTTAITIGGTIAAFRLNFLSIYSPQTYGIAGAVSDINQTGHKVWKELEALSFGDESFIFITSILTCFLLIRLSAKFLRPSQKTTEMEIQITFILSSIVLKFSTIWLALSLAAMAFRPLLEIQFRKYDSILYLAFVASTIATTFASSIFERKAIIKLKETNTFLIMAGIVCAMVAVAVENVLASAISANNEPTFEIIATQKCDHEACIVLINSNNIDNQIIASKLRLTVNLTPLDGSTSNNIAGFVDIELSPSVSGPGALILDTKAEQIAFVRNISFVCPFNPEVMKSRLVSELKGNGLMHVLQSNDANAMAMANFEVTGNRVSLLRLAKPACTKF